MTPPRRRPRPVPVVELASAAGAGAEVLSEEIKGYAWFRSSWLADHGLDHKQCVIIGVKGESMEPTLMDGCSHPDGPYPHPPPGWTYLCHSHRWTAWWPNAWIMTRRVPGSSKATTPNGRPFLGPTI